MKAENRKTELMKNAAARLQETLGAPVEFVPDACPGRLRADAMIRLRWQKQALDFAVEIKERLTLAALGAVILRIKAGAEKKLLVAGYVNPRMAERLKQAGVGYIDTAGNAHINEPPLLIYVKGNKPEGLFGREPPKRAFRPAGLKILFAFLCNPGLEGRPYREVADRANVALGTVNLAIKDLMRMGYVVDRGKHGRRLVKKEALLTRWVEDYPDQLRPGLLVGRYRTGNLDWWKENDLRKYQAYWGAEVAAAKLTQYLKPAAATIYARQQLGELLLRNGARQDPEGNVEVLDAFWNFEYTWDHPDLVPPILIYADLLATDDERDIETARLVYEREIARFVREG